MTSPLVIAGSPDKLGRSNLGRGNHKSQTMTNDKAQMTNKAQNSNDKKK